MIHDNIPRYYRLRRSKAAVKLAWDLAGDLLENHDACCYCVKVRLARKRLATAMKRWSMADRYLIGAQELLVEPTNSHPRRCHDYMTIMCIRAEIANALQERSDLRRMWGMKT